MLSDQGTAFDLITHEGKFEFEGYENDYMMMIAYLGEDVSKQLFVHRISNDSLIKDLEIGLSEAMIVSGKVNPAYYLPIPFLPYYLTAYLSGLYNDYNYHDDKYIGIDFRYDFYNDIEVYGELLVDEFPQTAGAKNPDKRAHLLEVYYPYNSCNEIRLEYSNVFNYVYLHRFPENSYTYDGNYIGHWLGHDGDVLDLQWKRNYQISSLGIGLRYLRRGIGDMETDFGPDHKEKKFLAETTASQALIRLSYSKEIRDNMSFDIDSDIGKEYLKEETDKEIFNIYFALSMDI